MNTVSGILVIDKPIGLTSMGVCRRIRRRLVNGGAPKRVKVGHAGTLDPQATGVLVIMIGRCTRQCEQVMATEKRYVAEVNLSAFSTTDDVEGERTAVDPERIPTRSDIETACSRFVGTIDQTPPAYSAIKVGGRRAYALARRGEAPELKARPVVIHAIDVLDYVWPVARIDVRCGKGTYIRSLARDLGGSLGTGGMLDGLRRTAVGRYTIEVAHKLDAVPDPLVQADLPM